MNLPALTLAKILDSPEECLDFWKRLKLAYFNKTYASVYTYISKFYNEHLKLPDFKELEVYNKSINITNTLEVLKDYVEEYEDVDIELIIEALENEYSQDFVLNKLDNFLENISLYNSEEIKEQLINIPIELDKNTVHSDKIIFMNDINIFDEDEVKNRVFLGLNNGWDLSTGGVALTELILIGGFRGSGKSIICTNIVNNQYKNGNVGLYFSIEMRAREVFLRTISNLSNVAYKKLALGKANEDELFEVAKIRAKMFIDGEQLIEEYTDFRTFEREANRLELKEEQIIIIDDQELSLAAIDLHLHKFKARFKDKLKVVVVDYLNTISIQDVFDWKSQIYLSAGLKSLARKYNVAIISPYQTSEGGEVKFSKAILDKADMAMKVDAEPDHLHFTSVKTRSCSPIDCCSQMNWDTLRINPTEYVPENKEEAEDL